ncbi:UNVERIFIED_CONTAM: GNAT acetyltransferase-like protein [Acetivibrio alkalicellulosi]
MYYLKKEDRHRIGSIFDGWKDTLIWSCLQGYMGNAWVDDIQNPKSAQIITADFCFFSGVPNVELVKNIPEFYPCDFIIMIPQNGEWSQLIEQEYSHNSEKFMRYSIKKEPDIFDRQKLNSYIEKLPSEYSIRKIDKEIYNKIQNQEWLKYLCSQFYTYSDFERQGLGFVVLHNNEPVSGASSYTVYDKGIEIEIDTIEGYRRKGLALASASKLILECLDRGLYPSWDAANKESVKLAEKLGYHFEKEYVAYCITDLGKSIKFSI